MPAFVDSVAGGGERVVVREPSGRLPRCWLRGMVVVSLRNQRRRFPKRRVPRLGRSSVEVAPGLYMIGGLAPSAVYVIDTSEGLILVDSGLDQDAGLLKSEMAKLGLDWKRVRAILLTHVHGDHSGGAEALRSATGAKVYAGRRRCAGPCGRRAARGVFQHVLTCPTSSPTRPPSMSLSRGVRRSLSATSASRLWPRRATRRGACAT